MALEKQIQIPKKEPVLVICLAGMRRSPTLVDYLRYEGYEDVMFGGIGWKKEDRGYNPLAVKDSDLRFAKYIITVEPTITDMLKVEYQISEDQMLIELNIPDQVAEDGYTPLRTLGEISIDIIKQIQPYLEK